MALNINRAGRKLQIYNHVLYHNGVSTHALAKALGMANSGHFRGIICEMANEGLITFEVDQLKNGKQRFRWFAQR